MLHDEGQLTSWSRFTAYNLPLSTPKQGPFGFVCGRVQDPVATVSIKYLARIPEALCVRTAWNDSKIPSFPLSKSSTSFKGDLTICAFQAERLWVWMVDAPA